MMSIQADDTRALALQAAIHSGDVETLQRHLRADTALATAKVIDLKGVGRTLLHIVADWPGHFPNGAQTVAVLVASGADANARVILAGPHPSAETPLHWAASSDDVDVLDALLDGGADIEAPGAVFTGTAMSDAVVFAQWRAARRLLERGAATTIWQAAALGLVDRVQDYCSVEPSLERQQITNAFWHACRSGQQSTAAYLLDRGADLNWLGYDHKTPSDAAREGGDDALIQWLGERGAKRAIDLI